VIAAVRPKQVIISFFKMLRVALSICETTWGLLLMSRRELRHPHVMGQIILLSRVISHELSFMSVPLVDRLALFGGGFSLGSSIRSSRLVWGRRVDCFGRSCRLTSSCPPSLLFSFWVWGGSSHLLRLGEGFSLSPRVSGGASLSC